jgi:hypothetical protein
MCRTSGSERRQTGGNYLQERKNMMYTDTVYRKALSPRTESWDIQGRKYKYNLHGQLSLGTEIWDPYGQKYRET